MKQLLVKLLFSVLLLVALVQAQDYSKLTPEQKKQLISAISGSMGKKSAVVSCNKTGCGPGYVCVGGSWGCAIPEGSKCKPAVDKCQGRYYCSGSGICNGTGRGKLGVACKESVDCDKDLYCDLKESKCLKVEGGSLCTRNAECAYKCSSGDCVCSGSKCVNR